MFESLLGSAGGLLDERFQAIKPNEARPEMCCFGFWDINAVIRYWLRSVIQEERSGTAARVKELFPAAPIHLYI